MATSTSVAGEAGTAEGSTIGVSEWRMIWRRLRRKRLGMVALVVIGVVYGAGVFAPLLAPYSYTQTNLDLSRRGPSSEHWFGTDTIGRDMFSRTLYSARTTLIVTTAVVLSGSLVIGNTLGLLAGYRGGWIDTVIMRVGEIFAGLPSLIMLILINVTLGPRVTAGVRALERITGIEGLVASGAASYFVVFGALSLFFWVGTARLIRAQVLQLRERDFIVAAEALGARPRRVISHHLLPNVSFLIVLAISSSLGGIAGSEIALTWFGVGVQPPAPSFGQMLSEGAGPRTLQSHPHLLLVPGTVVTLLLFAFNLLGDALNDAIRSR